MRAPVARRVRLVVVTALVALLVGCSTAQLQRAQQAAMTSARATAAALPLIGRVVTAYGSPYADLIVAFAAAVSPNRGEDDDDYDDEDYDYDDEDYDDEDYDDEDYDDEDYDDEDYDYEDDEDYEDDDDYDDEDYDYEDDEDFEDYEYDELTSALADGAKAKGTDPARKAGRASRADRLVAEVDIVREVRAADGRFSVEPVADGDVLTENDNYKLQVRCDRPCYAYIAQLDATGRMDPILPSTLVDVANPLEAGRGYSIPGGTRWFYLDENKGVEQVHFILSEEPRPDIERIFGEIAEANEGLERLEEVSIEPEEILPLTRGIAGVRQGGAVAVTTSNGGESGYIATELLSSIDAELVLTRWFRHE